MKTVHALLLIAYLGFIGYSLGLFVSGEAGMKVLNEREIYRNELLQNIDDLNILNTSLTSELKLMRTSTEKNRLLARSLGYYAPDEYPVFSHLFKRNTAPLQIGRILTAEKPSVYIKNTSIALAVFICLCISTLIVFVTAKKSK